MIGVEQDFFVDISFSREESQQMNKESYVYTRLPLSHWCLEFKKKLNCILSTEVSLKSILMFFGHLNFRAIAMPLHYFNVFVAI